MRKIEEEMNAALRAGTPLHRANTAVEWHSSQRNGEPHAVVLLHGNHIATYYPEQGDLHIATAGWNTKTTRSRLNALLEGLGVDVKVFSIKKNLYLVLPTGSEAWSGWMRKFQVSL